MTPQKPAKPATAERPFDRRRFLTAAAATGAALSLGMTPARANIQAAKGPAILRPIPGTEERIPVIGMGTWITFNVGGNRRLRDARAKVLKTF